MKLWQVKWFRIGVFVSSSLLAVAISFFIFLLVESSNSLSPTPTPNFETPSPSFQGNLPEPKTLGVKTKEITADPILTYHHIQDIADPKDSLADNLSVSPDKFKEEMNYLSSSGYKTALISELFDDLPEKRVVITFDDGYKDIVENALPILKNLGMRGVVFIITNDVDKPGYMDWNDLKKLVSEGWEIGSHSLTHPDFRYLSDSEAEKQIIESKKFLEKNLGVNIRYFCYPAGKYTQKTISILKSDRYIGAVTTDYGIENLKQNIFELKRVRIEGRVALSSFKSFFK